MLHLCLSLIDTNSVTSLIISEWKQTHNNYNNKNPQGAAVVSAFLLVLPIFDQFNLILIVLTHSNCNTPFKINLDFRKLFEKIIKVASWIMLIITM